jgi:hypothetical protein
MLVCLAHTAELSRETSSLPLRTVFKKRGTHTTEVH